MTCERCGSKTSQHTWRTDMATLTVVDDYRCLDCGHAWVDEMSYAELHEMTRDEAREVRRVRK